MHKQYLWVLLLCSVCAHAEPKQAKPPQALSKQQLARIAAIPKPEYPQAAIERGESGSVTVRWSVDANQLVRTQIIASSGYRSLDNAAIRYVRNYAHRFPLAANKVYSRTFVFKLPAANLPTALLVNTDALTAPYPKAAQRRHLRGQVSIAWQINRWGHVTDITVLSSSHALFTQAALAQARTAKFKAAHINGEPVASYLQHTYQFGPPLPKSSGE
ncbi:energy transducer TonB [Vitreoscilla massiliensis]|uniref:Energy transducer TonB n=1 Tax=Vitreoscilla massiliensis TaxID=1689272 RepID=A0ABY4DZP9_9NEIS|nr:energy transducer TonB [Vitreoscilla massiliensis]UOO88005.1 energy transducer TonB [Vitreoscilla massiliensis]